jgi:hypothetical protein
MALNKLTESLKEKVAGASEFLSDLKDESKEKLLNYVNSLGEILPIIAETGYRLEAFDIEVSIPPGINLQFKKVLDVPKEKIESILEENKDKELLKLIVNSLVAADEFHKKVKVGSYVFTDISVDLSIPPKVHIKFVRK